MSRVAYSAPLPAYAMYIRADKHGDDVAGRGTVGKESVIDLYGRAAKGPIRRVQG